MGKKRKNRKKKDIPKTQFNKKFIKKREKISSEKKEYPIKKRNKKFIGQFRK